VRKSNEFDLFYDNPLKKAGSEAEHDRQDAEHFDEEARGFLEKNDDALLLVDFAEKMPPRHRAFWDEFRNVAGLKILDVGCGYGYSACRLALMGAKVTAIDVSGGMCGITRKAAGLNNVAVDVHRASAVSTGFEDVRFDMIAGQVSLHHLPMPNSAIELRRILKKGGMAVFLEPVQGPRWLLKIRGMLPLPCRESVGGGALRKGQIAEIGKIFGSVEVKYFAIFERLRRIKLFDRISPVLYFFDRILLALPFMRAFAAHALIILKKAD
jgi:SAM-dependent methyltransferase